ncbi:MAG: DUF177 domain-containing protein [Acidobacteriota bacterium]
MIVRGGDLRPEGVRLELKLELQPLSYGGDLEIGVEAANLKAWVRPSRDGVTCTGHLTAHVLVPCSRCIEPYAVAIDRNFDLSYVSRPAGLAADNLDLRIPRRDLNVGYLDDNRSLDMDSLAVEQIYLELPMKPLCSSDCRGLCVHCGANLNMAVCRCAHPHGPSPD